MAPAKAAKASPRRTRARPRVGVPSVPPLVGVDEAGRGPVFGPLVVAGVSVRTTHALTRLGVADSKTLTPARRESLAAGIFAKASVALRVVDVETLDRRMATESLNAIEMDAFAEVLAELSPGTAYLDACDVNAERFGHEVANRAIRLAPALAREGMFGAEPGFGVVSRHGADRDFPAVAAASIVAKVERDAAMQRIAKEYGDVGSGYSHDPRTRAFLDAYHEEHGAVPPFARRFWQTSQAYERVHRPFSEYDHTEEESG